MCEKNRAQSELLGFLLIFAMVVLIIALVSATGFVGFNNAQEYQRSANAEGAFTALASNVDDVTRRGAPSRSTELRIADASLSVENERSSVEVRLDGSKLDLGGNHETGSIVYDSGTGTTISYRSGALIREDDGNSLLFREPDFVITEEEVLLPITHLSPDGTSEVGGTSGVDVWTLDSGTEVITADTPVADNVTIVFETPHVDAWTRYFEQFEDGGPVTKVSSDSEAGTVEVEIETDRISVIAHRVTTRFR